MSIHFSSVLLQLTHDHSHRLIDYRFFVQAGSSGHYRRWGRGFSNGILRVSCSLLPRRSSASDHRKEPQRITTHPWH